MSRAAKKASSNGAILGFEKKLWTAADKLRNNMDAAEYKHVVLGLIFLKFADNNYARAEQAINEEFAKLTGTRREKPIDEIAIEKCGFYLPPHARYDYLLNLPEKEDVAKKIFGNEERFTKSASGANKLKLAFGNNENASPDFAIVRRQ